MPSFRSNLTLLKGYEWSRAHKSNANKKDLSAAKENSLNHINTQVEEVLVRVELVAESLETKKTKAA